MPTIPSRVWVTIDGVWIGNLIYWTLTEHALRFLSLLYLHWLSTGNGFQRRSFLSFRVHVLSGRRLLHKSFPGFWLTETSRYYIGGFLYAIVTDRVEDTAPYCFSSIVAVGTCLWSRYSVTAVVYLLIPRSLHSNSSMCHNRMGNEGFSFGAKWPEGLSWSVMKQNRG
jgi:hypothetical protein